MNVALFITCLTEQFTPRAGVASTLVLEHLGCRVHFPEAQTCCGQPMFNTGHHEDAAILARRMIDVFDQFEAIVTPSGSCAAMVKIHAPELLKGDQTYAARAKALAAKTYEFVEFLSRVLRVDLAALNARHESTATIHPACHLRELGLMDEPAKLLAQINGLELRPLPSRDECCGFGGAFSVKHPAISGKMVENKVANVVSTRSDSLVCSDAGCAMNIDGACRKSGVRQRILSAPEIIAESLGLLPREPSP
ncbi:MAG: (Fe-S)-binding protein [Phycisphaerales bacterium]|nr:(Fe-S)-binding protein [Phycisphaerales bacterium]